MSTRSRDVVLAERIGPWDQPPLRSVAQPVAWCEPLESWLVTRHADVSAALRNPDLSSQRTKDIVRGQVGESGLTADYERITQAQMLFRDGADHHRLRVLGNRGFTPTLLERARPLVQRVVEGLLAAAEARGTLDFVAEFSQPLPALVIAELFGIPAADRLQFQAWSDAAAGLTGISQGNPQEEARRANAGMRSLELYFLRLLAERAACPGSDLISLLLDGQAEGRLTPEEVCAQCILILAAGHVTTIDQLANSLHALLTHPSAWRQLCEQPELVPAAVEETLRFDPSVGLIQRVARAETRIGEQSILAGQSVWLCTAAANRDGAVFSDPHRFDIARDARGHLAFGAGPHVCLGAGLARLELHVALAALARRFPGLCLARERPQRRRDSLVFRGFAALPVELGAGKK